ncbi:hypothetical protein K3495_g8721 [Podosphaera aphanis]|nr:hypothetical protein K3495_g8721 [Podosphaera aphanis]
MSDLDQIVKGTAPEALSNLAASTSGSIGTTPLQDPIASLPSSPPQVYLNLLILEASLRAQWLRQRSRRRQHTFFLTLLALWNMYFFYALFLAPREDGNGVGGSIYWFVEAVEKLCLLGGIVTGVLVWGTGQWERGVRMPRRWLYSTNRGLRGFNCKLVVIRQSWWAEILSMLSFLFSYGLFSGHSSTSFRYVDSTLLRECDKAQDKKVHDAFPVKKNDKFVGYEEDLAPGGDYIKLLLLPKPFSPSFRENWDVYRTEYWEKENERRAILRMAVKDRDKKIAKQRKGILWTRYLDWLRGRNRENEKPHRASHKNGHKERYRVHGGDTRSAAYSSNTSLGTISSTGSEGRSSGQNRYGNTVSSVSGKRMKGSVKGSAQRPGASARPSLATY